MDFNINIPVKVVSGRDCIKSNAHLLLTLGKSCLIVTGGKSAKISGAIADVTNALSDQNISYEIYDKISANPLISSCYEAGKIANTLHVDFIIGIGGGSPLDAAKAVAIYAANPDMQPLQIYTSLERNKALPIVCVGTTAGTGSEVGKVSVLTNDETGRKKSISPDDCFPSITFADYKYTESMPFSITCSTALDALCHALEGYFTSKCTDIPAMFGEKAISLIWSGLKELYNTKSVPTSAMREQLYYGSLYAGITLSYCGTAFPHPLGYVLTENYNVPHGFACATFLPAFMQRAEKFQHEKFSKVLSIINENIHSFNTVVTSLTDIGNISMTADEIEMYCSRWNESIPGNFTFSPGEYTKEDAKELFNLLFNA